MGKSSINGGLSMFMFDYWRVSFMDSNYHFAGNLTVEADGSSSQVAYPQRRWARQCPALKLEELQNHTSLAPRHHALEPTAVLLFNMFDQTRK